jgi:KDO2-lipid IV(A) lauroyltransferase
LFKNRLYRTVYGDGHVCSNAEGYRLHFLPADAGIASKDELVATTALNAGVEACIALVPEQYLWSYKRFRKPPPGVVDIYKS